MFVAEVTGVTEARDAGIEDDKRWSAYGEEA